MLFEFKMPNKTQMLKRNIQKTIEDFNDTAKRLSTALQKSPCNPKKRQIEMIMEYVKTQARYHTTTLLLVKCTENDKDPIPLIAKRKEYMGQIMEQMIPLIAEGVFSEQDYLEKCMEFKEDVKLLESD